MIEIIPAIDIINGKCVRLTRGDYSDVTEYREDPVDLALRFEDHGLTRLHVVDLDGARDGRVINYNTLERIASKSSMVIDAGGGLKTDEDLRIVFESGASMVTGGSIAVKDPTMMEGWLERYGAEKIILGSDFRDRKIAVSGWKEDSGEDLFAFLEHWTGKGIIQTISTDISRDGVLKGPSTAMYREMMERFGELKVIASGGVSKLGDLEDLVEAGVPAVIIGKAIYEGKIELKELEAFL